MVLELSTRWVRQRAARKAERTLVKLVLYMDCLYSQFPSLDVLSRIGIFSPPPLFFFFCLETELHVLRHKGAVPSWQPAASCQQLRDALTGSHISFANCFWSLMCFGSLKVPLPWTKLSRGPGYCEVGSTEAARKRLLGCGWKGWRGRAARGKVWVQMTRADQPSLAHHPLPWLKRQGMHNKLQHSLSCMAYEVFCTLWNTFVYNFFLPPIWNGLMFDSHFNDFYYWQEERQCSDWS